MLNIKQLTQSENVLVLGVLSIFFSSLLGAVAAGLQYIQLGHFNLATLVTIAGTAFCAIFGKMLADYVPKNMKTIMAVKDDLLQQKDAVIADQQRQLQDKSYIQEALTFLKTNPPKAASPSDVSQQVVNALAPLLQAQPVNVTIAQPTPVIPQPIAPTALPAPIAVQAQDNTPVQAVVSISDVQAPPDVSALPTQAVVAQPSPLLDTSDVLHFPVISQQMPAVQVPQSVGPTAMMHADFSVGSDTMTRVAAARAKAQLQ